MRKIFLLKSASVSLLLALLPLLWACGLVSTAPEKSEIPQNPPAVNNPTAENYTVFFKQNSLVWNQSYFYSYIPNSNSIAKIGLSDFKFKKMIHCDSCSPYLTGMTVHNKSSTLIIFNEGQIKTLDLITDTFFDLPDFKLTKVDSYFNSADGDLFGFLDHRLQNIYVYNHKNGSGCQFPVGLTGGEKASLVRSSKNGAFLAAFDLKTLSVVIFSSSAKAPSCDYTLFSAASLQAITGLSPAVTGSVVDAEFTANDNQLLVVTDKGYILNLSLNSSFLALNEYLKEDSALNNDLFLSRINPDPGLRQFQITYWSRTDNKQYGVLKYQLSDEGAAPGLTKTDHFNFSDNKSSALYECRHPVQILPFNDKERIIHCYGYRWLYQNDNDPTGDTFIPGSYTDKLNYSTLINKEKKELIAVMDNLWGEVWIYSLDDRTERSIEDQLVDDFFQ